MALQRQPQPGFAAGTRVAVLESQAAPVRFSDLATENQADP